MAPPSQGVWRLAFGVWRLAFGVWRLAFGVWRLAFGVRRSAFGVRRSAFVLVLERCCLQKRRVKNLKRLPGIAPRDREVGDAEGAVDSSSALVHERIVRSQSSAAVSGRAFFGR